MKVTVRVTPRAAADRVDGIDSENVVRVRVTAPPADGAANAAVVKVLAKALGLASRDVVLVAGAGSRTKVFDVPLDFAEIRERLLSNLR